MVRPPGLELERLFPLTRPFVVSRIVDMGDQLASLFGLPKEKPLSYHGLSRAGCTLS